MSSYVLLRLADSRATGNFFSPSEGVAVEWRILHTLHFQSISNNRSTRAHRSTRQTQETIEDGPPAPFPIYLSIPSSSSLLATDGLSLLYYYRYFRNKWLCLPILEQLIFHGAKQVQNYKSAPPSILIQWRPTPTDLSCLNDLLWVACGAISTNAPPAK